MITSITKELIQGTLKIVQTIVYSDGKQVKRVLDPQTMIPTEVIEIKEA
jgi:hypothetical protein